MDDLVSARRMAGLSRSNTRRQCGAMCRVGLLQGHILFCCAGTPIWWTDSGLMPITDLRGSQPATACGRRTFITQDQGIRLSAPSAALAINTARLPMCSVEGIPGAHETLKAGYRPSRIFMRDDCPNVSARSAAESTAIRKSFPM